MEEDWRLKHLKTQLYLRGNQGETVANDSVAAVRDIVANSTPPQGLKAYVTGPAALTSDQHHARNQADGEHNDEQRTGCDPLTA